MANKERRPKPVSKYIPNKEIKLLFFSLVIRNQALEQKYKGGLNTFVNKHYCYYNDDITTIDVMSQGDLYDDIVEILQSGLVNDEDFIWFYAMHGDMKGPEETDLGVDWLKAYILNGSTIIRYADEPKVRGKR